MGTNYYVKSKACKCCGHKLDQLHIGKSSVGWTFSFKGYKHLKSWEAWKAFLKDKQIVNEYDEPVSLDKLIKLVENKRHEKLNHTIYCWKHHPEVKCFLDSEGNSFSEYEFS